MLCCADKKLLVWLTHPLELTERENKPRRETRGTLIQITQGIRMLDHRVLLLTPSLGAGEGETTHMFTAEPVKQASQEPARKPFSAATSPGRKTYSQGRQKE